jgi:hypothetical protein
MVKKIFVGGGVVITSAFILSSVLSFAIASADTSVGLSSCSAITANFGYGDNDANTGGQVSMLQSFLANQGYFKPAPSGSFGPITRASVVAFQRANSISPLSGRIGPITRGVITRICAGSVSSAGNSGDNSSVVITTATPPVATNTATTAYLDVSSDNHSATTTTSIMVNVGEKIHYNWAATNADQFLVTYSSPTPQQCGAAGSWPFSNNAAGGVTATIPASQAGCVYSINYSVKNSANGQTAAAHIDVQVRSSSASTAGSSAPISITADHTVISSTGSVKFTLTKPTGSTAQSLAISCPDGVSTASDGGSSDSCNKTIDVTLKSDYTLAFYNTNQTMQTVVATYTATLFDGSKTAATKSISVNTPGARLPTATLTVNGVHDVTLNVGDTISYLWRGANADKFSSVATVSGGSACGVTGVWIANNSNGSYPTTVIPASIAGCSYTVTYTAAQSTTGASTTDSLKVKINVLSAPTASLTASSTTATFADSHNVSILPGLPITYNWAATNADKFNSSFTSNNPAVCLSSTNWIANSASGSLTLTVPAWQKGCVYTIHYVATQSSTGASAQDTLIETVQ